MSRINYTIARLTVSFVWLYHGLVPKLLVNHPDEALPLLNAGISADRAAVMVHLAGWVEIAIGLSLLIFWRGRWQLWLTIAAMAAALFGVAFTAPRLLVGAFNPVSLNLSMIALSVIALQSGRENVQ